MSITIVRAVQTSAGCPSQWNAWDTEGQYYYLRYRRGHGTVHAFPDEDHTNWPWENWQNPVSRFDTDDPLEGFIAFDDFCHHAGLVIAPLVEYQCFGRYFNGQIADILKEINAQ